MLYHLGLFIEEIAVPRLLHVSLLQISCSGTMGLSSQYYCSNIVGWSILLAHTEGLKNQSLYNDWQEYHCFPFSTGMFCKEGNNMLGQGLQFFKMKDKDSWDLYLSESKWSLPVGFWQGAVMHVQITLHHISVQIPSGRINRRKQVVICVPMSLYYITVHP